MGRVSFITITPKSFSPVEACVTTPLTVACCAATYSEQSRTKSIKYHRSCCTKKFFKLFLSEINESVKTSEEKLKYQIALTQIPGIGAVLGKTVVSYCGSPEAVFRETKSRLRRIPGISEG